MLTRRLSNRQDVGQRHCFDFTTCFILEKHNNQLLGWIKHHRLRLQEETPTAVDGQEEPSEKL